MNAKNQKTRFTIWILLLGVAVLTGFMSWFVPWLGDDIHYGFSCTPGKQHIWISSISQIIESQNSHWLFLNGRYVAHFLVQLFIGMIGQQVFSIVNAVVYVLFMLLISQVAGVDIKNPRAFIAMIMMALFSFQTKFTPSCQIGFIWTFSLVLFYLNLFFKKDFRPQWWIVFVLVVYSMIAGNGQEALSIGIGGALIIYWAFNMRRMTRTQYLMMLSFGIGALLNCLSPGAISRAVAEEGGSSIINSLVQFFIEARAFYMLLIVVIWKCYKINIVKIYKSNMFYWNAWAILLGFNFILGVKSNRQIFGEELMALIISFRLIGSYKIQNVWMFLLGILLTLSYVMIGVSDFQSYRQWKEIKKQYALSENGIVYVDMNRPLEDLWYAHMKVADRITFSKIGDDTYKWVERHSNRFLHHFYPGKPDCIIVSPLLRGKDSLNLKSQIILIKFGVYLIIQNKKLPKNPVLKSFSRYGNAIDTIVEPIDMSQNIVIETPYWKARQYQLGATSPITKTKQTIVFE